MRLRSLVSVLDSRVFRSGNLLAFASARKIFSTLVFAGVATAATGHAEGRPNIVVILSDDMGYTDPGCYGGEIETPTLDRLAENGLRFTQFYNAARCVPTRASLLTGLYPHQAGLGLMTSDRGSAGYRGDLNGSSVTIAEVLKEAGYETFLAGKWHVTRYKRPHDESEKHNWPLQRGFDRFYGTIDGAGSYWDPSSLTRGNTFITPENDPEYQPETFYYTDAISDNAITFIKERDRSKPFFLYVAYTAAHWPLHALPGDVAKYEGVYDGGYEAIRRARFERAKALGVLPPDAGLSERTRLGNEVEDLEWERACMEVYAAMVDRMDQGIGGIVATLEAEGDLENTLILYLQDNGSSHERIGRSSREPAPPRAPFGPDELQDRVIPRHTRSGAPVRQGPGVMPGPADTYIAYGRGWANVSNTPFRMFKSFVHEGGISTPLIAHWPRGIAGGNAIRNTPGHVIDIMPTCVEISGANYPAEFRGQPIQPMEGRSLLPAFAGKEIERDFLFWEHQGQRAIRLGDWKLVAFGKTGEWLEDRQWELYDLGADRAESNDLGNVHPEKKRELIGLWRKQADRTKVVPWPEK